MTYLKTFLAASVMTLMAACSTTVPTAASAEAQYVAVAAAAAAYETAPGADPVVVAKIKQADAVAFAALAAGADAQKALADLQAIMAAAKAVSATP